MGRRASGRASSGSGGTRRCHPVTRSRRAPRSSHPRRLACVELTFDPRRGAACGSALHFAHPQLDSCDRRLSWLSVARRNWARPLRNRWLDVRPTAGLVISRYRRTSLRMRPHSIPRFSAGRFANVAMITWPSISLVVCAGRHDERLYRAHREERSRIGVLVTGLTEAKTSKLLDLTLSLRAPDRLRARMVTHSV